MNKVDMLTKLLGSGELERILKRAEEIETLFRKFDTLDTLVSYLRIIERKAYVLKDYLTADEAADYLGLSKSKVYKLTCAREISFYKPNGKTIYISRADINDWICSNRVVSQEEMDAKARQLAGRYSLEHAGVFTKAKKNGHGTR